MARRPTLWLRKSTGYWSTTLNGKQIPLARDKKEAEKAFHQLLASEENEPHVHKRPTFRKVADVFLEHSKRSNAASTYESHLRYIQSFADHVGKTKRVPELRGEHVTSWLRQNVGWGQSTRSLAIQSVKAALNHAVIEGLVDVHPLLKVKQGQIKRRERILTQEEREKIRGRAARNPAFADFLFALENTGARPFSEIARLEAKHVNWSDATAILPHHKNTRHGKIRTLFFTPEMMELLRRLAEKHPEGLLFRNRLGGQWDRFAFNKWTAIFEKELGIRGVTAYVYRHAYGSDALARGVPMPLLAELMGTSVRMLLHHYSHMEQKKEALRDAALRAMGQK